MKKPYLRSALATLGICAGTLLIEAQSGGAAGGAAGGGAAIGGTSATTAPGGVGTAGTGPGGTAVRGASGTQTGGRANPAGSVNAIGGASVIEANPNNSGASQSGITATAAPGTSQGAQAGQSLQVNTLPAGVQNTLGGFSANGALGSVTAVPGQPGTFRTTVTQNGQPMEITVGANGQILSRTPLAGSSLNTGAANLNANAGVPGTTPFVTGAAFAPTPVVIDDLPNTIQEAVRAQLGAAEANRIMQLRTASGVNYMVSYDQNGRPMTLMVGPDGRVISNGPAAPTATARATTADRSTNATRDVSMTLDDLPSNVEDVLKQTAPYAEVRTVTREQRVGGDVYVIAVREGDRAGDITIDANGKLIRDTRRDFSVLTARTPTQAEEKQIGMPYDSLPVAIKNAVKAYAASSDIRSVTLGLDNDSRTIYDVIFYRDGRRDRMVIRKDGTLVRIEENVSPALEYASTKPAVIALGDLPQEVQDTVRRQTDNVMVKEIETKEVANQTVYAVRWETNGAPVELLVSRDGVIIQPEGSAASESAGAPAVATLDREEAATVKIVDDTPGTQRATENVGTAARSEQGLSVSTDVNRSERPPSEVKLSDAPQPVQDTAKKIAGSGTIESISPKLEASGMVYEVRYLDDGQLRTVKIDRSGKVQPESTSP